MVIAASCRRAALAMVWVCLVALVAPSAGAPVLDGGQVDESLLSRKLLADMPIYQKEVVGDVPDDPEEDTAEDNAPFLFDNSVPAGGVVGAGAAAEEGEDDDDIKRDLEKEAEGRTYSRWPKHAMLRDALQPQLVGVGCQKCGTGSLFDSLKKHYSWIWGGFRKELHYFDNKAFTHIDRLSDVQIATFYSDYLTGWSQSAGVKCDRNAMRCKGTVSNRVAFELTPVYMNDRRMPFLLFSTLPHATEVKILFILRNPSTRAYSGLFQNAPGAAVSEFRHLALREVEILTDCYNEKTLAMAKGVPTPAQCKDGHDQYVQFHTCVKAMEPSNPWFLRYTVDSISESVSRDALKRMGYQKYEGVVLRGIYVDQIKNFLCAGFRPDQILVLTLSEFIEEEQKTLEMVARFMGKATQLDVPIEADKETIKNHRSKGEIDDVSLRVLDDFYRPYNEELFSLLFNTPGFTFNKEYILKEFRPKSELRSSTAPLASTHNGSKEPHNNHSMPFTTQPPPRTTIDIRERIKFLKDQQLRQLQEIQERQESVRKSQQRKP